MQVAVGWPAFCPGLCQVLEYCNCSSGEVPKNGIQNGEYCKKYWFAGLAFLPLNNVIIKVDYEHQHTDKPNPALVINPSPNAPAYITDRGFLNIGVGYSF